MRSPRSPCVVHNATIAHHDRVDSRPLAFANGRVVAEPSADAAEIDLRGHLIFPGLINAHDHLQLNNVPPLPHAAPFASSYAWIDAMAAHRARPDVAAAVAVPKAARLRQGALKNLLAGATTVAHHDPWHDALDDPDFPVHVPRDTGWCHSLGLGESGRYGPRVRESLAATPAGRPWVIHLAEGTDDDAHAELARLEALGALDDRTVLVHGVGLTDEGQERVVAAGAHVVWCPASNVQLLGRTLDPRRLLRAGRLSLGTDARLTGSRDLLDELRAAAGASDLAPAELLRLVTAAPRDALRLPDRGALDPGCAADCLVLRADGGDPYSTLLGAQRGAVRAVVRGGVPLVGDPDLAPWFARCGVDTVAVRVDGRPKLMARAVACPDAVAIESGLAFA